MTKISRYAKGGRLSPSAPVTMPRRVMKMRSAAQIAACRGSDRTEGGG